MASTYKNKYVSDIPLKRPQETFIDDPASVAEVSLHDLVFDLANDIKNVNSLHIFHALAVFKAVLEDLIYLGENKDACRRFRLQQLQSHSLDLDSLEREVALEGEIESTNIELNAQQSHEGNTPGSPINQSPPLDGTTDTAKDSSNEDISHEEIPESHVSSDTKPFTMNHADESVQSLETNTPDVELVYSTMAFISTESLVKTTSLDIPEDPITCNSRIRLRSEILLHMAPKFKTQAEHLLKCFSLTKAPPISIESFLTRIKTYLPSISVSVYIHSAYMMYMLCVFLDVTELTPLNVHRFILAALRCLTKKLEDVHQRQKNFATVGGVALKDLSRIEVSFLYLFNFKLVVSESILNQFLTSEFVALRAFCDDLRNTEKVT